MNVFKKKRRKENSHYLQAATDSAYIICTMFLVSNRYIKLVLGVKYLAVHNTGHDGYVPFSALGKWSTCT